MSDRSETFAEIVRTRRSVRAFQPKPVPEDVMRDVFTLAQGAPSNCNTQPWHTVVVHGAAIERLRERFPNDFVGGNLSIDFPYSGVYEGDYKTRQYGAAQSLYDALGIERSDKAARGEAFLRNFRFFDAPAVAFVFIPENFGIREAADIGMYAQTLMLALTAHGLASCPQTALSFFCDQVREEFGVAPEMKLLFGISFGYEDTEHPVNTCQVERAELGETTRFVE